MMKTLNPMLRVADVRRSLDYYRNVLGFEVTSELAAPNGELMHGSVKSGAVEIMLDPPMGDGAIGGGGATLYITLDGVDALAQRVRAAGAVVTQEPADQFWGHRTFALRDPDGYDLMFAEVIREMTDAEIMAAAEAMVPTPA